MPERKDAKLSEAISFGRFSWDMLCSLACGRASCRDLPVEVSQLEFTIAFVQCIDSVSALNGTKGGTSLRNMYYGLVGEFRTTPSEESKMLRLVRARRSAWKEAGPGMVRVGSTALYFPNASVQMRGWLRFRGLIRYAVLGSVCDFTLRLSGSSVVTTKQS